MEAGGNIEDSALRVTQRVAALRSDYERKLSGGVQNGIV